METAPMLLAKETPLLILIMVAVRTPSLNEAALRRGRNRSTSEIKSKITSVRDAHVTLYDGITRRRHA